MKLLMTTFAAALLSASAAMAQTYPSPSAPGDPDAMGGGPGCPPSTTDRNCINNDDGPAREGRSSTVAPGGNQSLGSQSDPGSSSGPSGGSGGTDSNSGNAAGEGGSSN